METPKRDFTWIVSVITHKIKCTPDQWREASKLYQEEFKRAAARAEVRNSSFGCMNYDEFPIDNKPGYN